MSQARTQKAARGDWRRELAAIKKRVAQENPGKAIDVGRLFEDLVFAHLCRAQGLSANARGVRRAQLLRPLTSLMRNADAVNRLDALGLRLAGQGPGVLSELVEHHVACDAGLAKRRRAGVYFTPANIARHIVACAFKSLEPTPQNRRVRVLDPACGAGNLLREVATVVHSMPASTPGFELYGVDQNPRVVEVAKRSLWLTGGCKSWRELDQNFAVGNAVLDDPKVAPDALDWSQAFTHVMADGGFDVVVGNPPYDVLAERERARPLADVLRYIMDDPVLAHSAPGKHNLYKLFLCRGLSLLRPGGCLSMIVPLSLLGDRQASGVRRFIFAHANILRVDCFPHKDDPRRRVFAEAKQATCIVTMRRTAQPLSAPHQVQPTRRFALHIHKGRALEGAEQTPALLCPREIALQSPADRQIPMCTREDWLLVQQIRRHPAFCLLGEVASQRQGEVNETTARQFLRQQGRGQAVLRGANVTRYCLRAASQGATWFLDRAGFIAGKRPGSKAFDFARPRVGFQRSAPANNYRRLIATQLPAGVHCFDTISYVTDQRCELPLGALVALLNSALYEWWFRLFSTNSKVNKYQFDRLPMLRFERSRGHEDGQDYLARGDYRSLVALARGTNAPGWALSVLDELANTISLLEAKRKLVSRRERAWLGPVATRLQAVADDFVFALFGLTLAQGEIIRAGLHDPH